MDKLLSRAAYPTLMSTIRNKNYQYTDFHKPMHLNIKPNI